MSDKTFLRGIRQKLEDANEMGDLLSDAEVKRLMLILIRDAIEKRRGHQDE